MSILNFQQLALLSLLFSTPARSKVYPLDEYHEHVALGHDNVSTFVQLFIFRIALCCSIIYLPIFTYDSLFSLNV